MWRGAQRRDALKRLIELAHSPFANLKVIAATNLKYFIKDFPDLEDDAINAVYDLCEDPVTQVREFMLYFSLINHRSGSCRCGSRDTLL